MFISERFQKVGKEGRGREGLKCGYNALIVMTIRAKVGKWDQWFLMKVSVVPLSFKVVMEGEDLNAEVTSSAARGGAGSFKNLSIYKSEEQVPIEIVFDMLCFATTVQHAEITTHQVVEKKQRQLLKFSCLLELLKRI